MHGKNVKIPVPFSTDTIVTQVPVHVGTVLGAFAKLRRTTVSFVMSVRMSFRPSLWNTSAPTERILLKSHICVFFENLSIIFKFHSNLTRITCLVLEDHYTFMIISRLFLLKLTDVSDISCRGS